MSTNYAISSFIHLDELKALTKIRSLGDTDSINGIVEVKINHINDINQKVNYIKDSLGNYLIFNLSDHNENYVISFDRFGQNNPDLIIDYIQEHCEVNLISEHEERYQSTLRSSFNNFKSKSLHKLKTFRFTRTQTIVDYQTIKALTLEEAENQLQLENWTDEEIHLSEFDSEEL